MKEKMQELAVAFAALDKKFKEVKGYPDSPATTDSNNVIYDMMSNIHSRISYMAESMWEYQKNHETGHTPKIKTASQMKSFLKACGMDGDYDIVKPPLYVNASKNTLEVNYTKKP